MTPEQFHALPTLSSRAWHETPLSTSTFLGEPDLWAGRPLHGKADASRAVPLAFDAKLGASGPGADAVTYLSVTWDGAPVGILVNDGHAHRRLVTDLPGWRAAREAVRAYVLGDPVLDDVVAPSEAVAILSGVPGLRVMGEGDDVRLVPEAGLDALGRPLVDLGAFRASALAGLRPPLVTADEAVAGLASARVRGDATRMVLSALAPGVAARALDVALAPDPRGDRKVDVPLVLAVTEEGTYAIGPHADAPPGRMSWVDAVRAERIGDATLYARLPSAGAGQGDVVTREAIPHRDLGVVPERVTVFRLRSSIKHDLELVGRRRGRARERVQLRADFPGRPSDETLRAADKDAVLISVCDEHVGRLDAKLAALEADPSRSFLPIGASVRVARRPTRLDALLREGPPPPGIGEEGVVIGVPDEGEHGVLVAFDGYRDVRGTLRAGRPHDPARFAFDASDLDVLALATFLDGTPVRSVEHAETHVDGDRPGACKEMVVLTRGTAWRIQSLTRGGVGAWSDPTLAPGAGGVPFLNPVAGAPPLPTP